MTWWTSRGFSEAVLNLFGSEANWLSMQIKDAMINWRFVYILNIDWFNIDIFQKLKIQKLIDNEKLNLTRPLISTINEDENFDDRVFICFKLPANTDASEWGQITFWSITFRATKLRWNCLTLKDRNE